MYYYTVTTFGIQNNFIAIGLIFMEVLFLYYIMNKEKINKIFKFLVNSKLKIILNILFFITLLFLYLVVIDFICLNKNLESILINLATEFLGMIITYFIIDLYLEIQAIRIKNERQNKALQEFDISLNKHFTFLFYIYKSTNVMPSQKIFNIEYINTDEFVNCLKVLKLNKTFSKEIPLIWIKYFKLRFIEFDIELNQIMNNYANYIDNISQVSNFLKHPYLNYIIHIFEDSDDYMSKKQIIDSIEFFKLYIESFVSNCSAINKIREFELKILESEWTNIVPPIWNSARNDSI